MIKDVLEYLDSFEMPSFYKWSPLVEEYLTERILMGFPDILEDELNEVIDRVRFRYINS